MKLGYIKLLIVEFIIFISLLFNDVIYNSNINTILFLLLIIVSLIFLIGYEKDKNLYKIDVIQNIVIFSIIFYIVTYILGLFTGYLKNSYNLHLFSIIKNVIPFLITLILIELIRYIIISKSKEKKYIIFIVTVLISIIDIMLNHGSYNFNSFSSSFYLITIYGLPTITKNLFLTYTTYNYGYKPSIVYRIIMEIPLFILPIFPNFGKYIDSIIKLLFPIFLYFKIEKLSVKNEKNLIIEKKYRLIINTIFVSFTIVVVYLTCGLFKYYAIAVGSGSMTPNINLGDVVIVEKVKKNNLDTLKEGDVLVYKHDNKTILHRIVVIKSENNRYIFRTKGDHNESSDGYDINGDDVIGKANFKISYIGYPVVWINQLFN